VDLRSNGSLTSYASLAMFKHWIDLHQMSNVKWARLWCDNAYATTLNFDTINASHTTLVLANPHHALISNLGVHPKLPLAHYQLGHTFMTKFG
jgi:hypothetical protein